MIIRREGRNVVLCPMFQDWDDYFENSTPFTDDYLEVMAEMPNSHLLLEERKPFD